MDQNREGGGDFVEACLPSTQGLKLCMEANPEYYGPLLVRTAAVWIGFCRQDGGGDTRAPQDGADEDGEGEHAGADASADEPRNGGTTEDKKAAPAPPAHP